MLIKRFEIGGAEDHVLELSNRLCKQGNSIYLFCRPGRKLSELHNKINYHPIYFKNIFLPLTLFFLVKAIKKHRIDLIHAHQDSPIIAGCVVSWLTGVPVVATIHGLLRKEVGFKFIQRLLSKVIVVSKNSYIGSQRYPILKSKAELIHNPLPKTYFNHMQFDRNKIIYASRIDRGHYSFIQLLLTQAMPVIHNHKPNISIQIAGDGQSYNTLKKIAIKANSLLGSNTVELLGYKENIIEVISNAGLVIGVGRVAMQALSLGVPVISANRKHKCSIVSLENYKYMRDNNFVSVEDPPPTKEQTAYTILHLLNNYDLYKAQTLQLAKLINYDYDSDLILSRTIRVYQNCIDDYTVADATTITKKYHFGRF